MDTHTSEPRQGQRQPPIVQEMKVKGSQLVDKFKEILEEGNARHVSIRKDGRTLMDFPLSVGIGGAAAAVLFAPMLAAIGGLAAAVSDVEIVVQRETHPVDPSDVDAGDTPSAPAGHVPPPPSH